MGKTNSAADFTSLITDVTERLFDRLPDTTWVDPGHGNDTTLGTERPHLGEWRARGWLGPHGALPARKRTLLGCLPSRTN